MPPSFTAAGGLSGTRDSPACAGQRWPRPPSLVAALAGVEPGDAGRRRTRRLPGAVPQRRRLAPRAAPSRAWPTSRRSWSRASRRCSRSTPAAPIRSPPRRRCGASSPPRAPAIVELLLAARSARAGRAAARFRPIPVIRNSLHGPFRRGAGPPGAKRGVAAPGHTASAVRKAQKKRAAEAALSRDVAFAQSA